MKFRFYVIVLTATACLLPTDPEPVATISLMAPEATIPSGGIIQLQATPLDRKGNPVPGAVIQWSSSDTRIATVSASGLVSGGAITGANIETTVIRAQSDGVTGTISIQVEPLPIGRIQIEADTIEVVSGAALPIPIRIESENGTPLTGRQISFALNDPAVGRIGDVNTIVSTSYTTPEVRWGMLTATAGAIADSAVVKVLPMEVANLAVSMDSLFFVDERRHLRVEPRAASGAILEDREISLTVADAKVARIVGDSVEGIAPGRTHVTVHYDSLELRVPVQVDTATTFTFPVALAELQYPDSYLTPTRSHADLVSDPCWVAPPDGRITIPKDFLGTRGLPELRASDRAPASAVLGVRMKDVWDHNNAAYVLGHFIPLEESCRMNIRDAFRITVQRLKELNASYVTLTPWAFGVESDTERMRIASADELWKSSSGGTSTMDDADLRWAVQEAHRHGLEVHWINQIQGICEHSRGGDCYGAPKDGTNPESVARFMGAYREYMLDRAQLLQDAGVDVMDISCTCWFPTWHNDDVSTVYFDSIKALIPDLIKVFRGQLRADYTTQIRDYPSVLSNLTFLLYHASPDYSREGFQTVSMDDLTAHILDRWECQMVRCVPGGQQTLPSQLKAIFNVSGPSHPWLWDYVEEAFCTPTTNETFIWWGGCIQRAIPTDFSLQASLVLAYLRAFSMQTILPVAGFEIGDYWMVDKLDPTSSFPNLGYTPRNKPAEAIVQHWFR